MGKKYEPVPDSKRKELIHLIYNKGMNISRAAKQAEIYYPTAKAINKIYLKQNRICKKTNRNRVKKPTDFKIKIDVSDMSRSNKREMTQDLTYESANLYPNFAVQETHVSTACETTKNEISMNLTPRKDNSTMIKFAEQEIATKQIMNIPENELRNEICPFHTPENAREL
jgi:hypothetical protein